MEQEETIEYLVGSQIETLGRSWTGCVTDNFHTIRDNRTSNNARVTRKRGCFRNHGRLARGIRSKSVATLEGQKTLRETLREYLGPLSQKYVEAILTGDRENDMDGIYLDKDGMIFGSKRFDVNKAEHYYRWCAICRYIRSLRVDLQKSPR